MRFHVKLTFLLVLSTCFAVAQEQGNGSPTTDVQASSAVVHFYRYKQFVGSALAPSVFCDGVQLARMENGRYFTAKVAPGKHTLTSNDQQSGIELDAKAGEEYFVRIEIAAGVMKGHGRLILMSHEQGSYEMKSDKLKPLEANKIADKTTVSGDQPHLQPAALEDTKK
ncbi:MAG: DUF2846 domain-containing protein [Acidobacteriaceae bacterium]|nr:DUF2846 domain-containing protein [Acidobacteriaceae bacterium]